MATNELHKYFEYLIEYLKNNMTTKEALDMLDDWKNGKEVKKPNNLDLFPEENSYSTYDIKLVNRVNIIDKETGKSLSFICRNIQNISYNSIGESMFIDFLPFSSKESLQKQLKDCCGKTYILRGCNYGYGVSATNANQLFEFDIDGIQIMSFELEARKYFKCTIKLNITPQL